MIAALPTPRSMEGGFSLEAFIAEFGVADTGFMERQLPILTRLTRKAEVARRLFTAYTPDLERPASSEILSPAHALALTGLLLAAAERFGDYRSLNCAIKMLDGIVIEPPIGGSALLEAWAGRLLD